MFKSLIRTIPSISGNFTLACILNNNIKKNDKEYVSYINNAKLIPLDNNLRLFRDININLVNAKYEYDVQRYYKLITNNFYKDTFIVSKDIFDNYDGRPEYLTDDRDKNFEFGCKRISFTNYEKQLQFFAPIYVNKYEDLPDYFILSIKNEHRQVLKTIQIPIKKQVGTNKISVYLKKFLVKIYDNIPVHWEIDNKKIIYKNVIDCKNGGLIDFTSYNVIQNNSKQVVINDFDNSISLGYASNNIIMSEIIPLSFIFSIDDFLKDNETYYYDFNSFYISGHYVKDGANVPLYDFDVNYHFGVLGIRDFDNKLMTSNVYKYNIFNNDLKFAYNEGTNEKLYYENTIKHNYCKWKLYESEDYIINANASYTSIYNKYDKFPILKNNIDKLYAKLTNENDLILPTFTNTYLFEEKDSSLYNYVMNNYMADWFELYDDNIFSKLSLWTKPINGNVFHKGILYKNIPQDVDYFGVFVKPFCKEYNSKMIYGDVILNSEILNVSSYINRNYLSMYSSNKYFEPIDDIESYEEDYVYISHDLTDNIYIKYDETILQDLEEYSNARISFIDNYARENLGYEESAKITMPEQYLNYAMLFVSQKGYEKLTHITNTNCIINDYLLFKYIEVSNRKLYNSLYYSYNNSKNKQSLKSLIDDNFNINTLQNNIMSFFMIDEFVHIFNKEEIDNKVNELFEEYMRTCKIEKALLNIFIERGIIKQKTIARTEQAITIDDMVYVLMMLYKYENEGSSAFVINGYVYKIIALLLYYEDINDYLDKNDVIRYIYIPYYNENNILIDYDYYEKLGNLNKSYDYVYVDTYNLVNYLAVYGISVNSLMLQNSASYKYIKIDNMDMLQLFIDEYYKQFIPTITKLTSDMEKYSNFYHYSCYIDKNLNISYKILPLKDYIKNYLQNTNFYASMVGQFGGKYTIFDDITNDTLEVLLNTCTTIKDGQFIITISFLDKKIEIPCNILYKKYVCKLKENLYNEILSHNITTTLYKDYSHKIPESFIYELGVLNAETIETIPSSDIITFLLSSYNYNISTINEFQVIGKNLKLIKEGNEKLYVYENPRHIISKVSKASYMNNYSSYIPYKETDINTTSNNSDIIIEEVNGKKYAYIYLEYHFDLSTNSFNIYNIDNNDNINILTINENNVDDAYIYGTFKFLYPFLKRDLLLDNYTTLSKYIIFPTNISLYIDKISIANANNEFSKLNELVTTTNKIQINRYFGNIMPLFNKVDMCIFNQRSKLFKNANNKELNNITAYNNNLINTNINIYHYSPIKYIDTIENETFVISKVSQIEYKHFNDNKIYDLPTYIEISIDDYISINDLNDYINIEKCLEYFKKHIIDIYHIQLSDSQFLFLFNRYNITYKQDIVKTLIFNNQKLYKVTYELNLQ